MAREAATSFLKHRLFDSLSSLLSLLCSELTFVPRVRQLVLNAEHTLDYLRHVKLSEGSRGLRGWFFPFRRRS